MQTGGGVSVSHWKMEAAADRGNESPAPRSGVANQILNRHFRELRTDLTCLLRLRDGGRACKTAPVNLFRVFKG
jgi:hypothetical protein